MVATFCFSGCLIFPIRLHTLSIDGSGCGMTRGAEDKGDAGGKRNKANSYSCISPLPTHLPIEIRSIRGTYGADDGGGYRGRRRTAAGAPHTARGALGLWGGSGEGGKRSDGDRARIRSVWLGIARQLYHNTYMRVSLSLSLYLSGSCARPVTNVERRCALLVLIR